MKAADMIVPSRGRWLIYAIAILAPTVAGATPQEQIEWQGQLAPADGSTAAQSPLASPSSGGTALSKSETTGQPETLPDATVPADPRSGVEPYAVPGGSGQTSVPRKVGGNPYKGVFYDNDFSYLDKPDNTEFYFGDSHKRNHLGNAVIDVGGEYRLRQQSEHILTRNNNFLLQRTRVYGDIHYDCWFRVYMEAIDATSSWEDLPPRPIEENRFDALNLFADARLLAGDGGNLWLRGGRQELLYGAQRLISPLDWANTRRTFDGAKLFWRGEDWNADFFWTRPVPFSQHVNDDSNFDHPDPHAEFFGLYTTYRAIQQNTLDFYYLRSAKYDGASPLENHTFGGRWETNVNDWLGEVEAGYQFGEAGPRDQSAGFCTVGGGRKMAQVPWKPVFWVYYDWASGDRNPTDGTVGTFNQLFAFGHKYLGFMDLVGRQNIQDLNLQLTLFPHPQVEFMLWHHIFHLAEARDALYDAAGAAIRRDLTGSAGTDVGQELDVTARYLIGKRADLLLGYSHLFPGEFLLNTAGGAPGRDFYYTQFSLRF